MIYRLFDYVNPEGINEFKAWTEGLEKVQRAKLNERLDKLEHHGDVLIPQVLSPTHVAGILKLRIHGNVQLRPLLCRGPVDVRHEFTILMGAKEIGDKWSPKGAPEIAEIKKNDVKANPSMRRRDHERVSQETVKGI